MGNLKPIGSEKLDGMAKINRMIEIARYKENKPQVVNEDSSNEYSIRLSDGYKYHIIKEKNGYVLKKGLNESELDYIEPMKGRKYYSSYGQAMKRLNLITKEVNLSEGRKTNLSLFTEGEEGEKKYYLSMKRETTEQGSPTPAPAPAPVPAPAPAPVPAPDMAASPTPDMGTEMPAETEPPMDDTELEAPEPETTEPEQEEKVTFKTIQKLTGKLGQKLRTLASDEENPMSSKDIKYVINSILSALDLNSLEDEDRDQIMTKLEGGEEGMEGEEMAEPEMGTEETPETGVEGEEAMAEPPTPPAEEEMGEEYDSIDEYDEFEEYDEMGEYDMSMKGMKREESNMMEDMIEGIFSESKVDKLLKKYFKLDEKEKKFLKESKNLNNEIEKNSTSISQKVASKKFIKENRSVKFIGKTNKGSLVFQKGNKQYKITNKGQIL